MTAITKSVNGVVCVISPAVFGPGPNNQPVDFVGEGEGLSPTILVQFDNPISQFSLTVVGLTHLPHITKAFNSKGDVVEEQVTLPQFTSAANIISGRASGVSRVFFSNFKEPVTTIQLIPPSNASVGYRDLDVTKSTAVISNKPSQEVLQSEIILPEVKNINLRDVIRISKVALGRQYVKGSLKALPSETIVIENLSSDVEAQVSLSGLVGVSFEPSKFTLAALESKKIILNFDSTELEKLPAGTNIIRAAVNYSSNALQLPAIPPIIVKPVIIPPPPPPQEIEPIPPILPPPPVQTKPVVSVSNPSVDETENDSIKFLRNQNEEDNNTQFKPFEI
jgi:hypothetical protein